MYSRGRTSGSPPEERTTFRSASVNSALSTRATTAFFPTGFEQPAGRSRAAPRTTERRSIAYALQQCLPTTNASLWLARYECVLECFLVLDARIALAQALQPFGLKPLGFRFLERAGKLASCFFKCLLSRRLPLVQPDRRIHPLEMYGGGNGSDGKRVRTLGALISPRRKEGMLDVSQDPRLAPDNVQFERIGFLRVR